MNTAIITASLLTLIFLIVFLIRKNNKKIQQISFVQQYRMPQDILFKFREMYPNLSGQEEQLVIRGLKEFFFAYLSCNQRQRLLMPSKVVDDLWHCFFANHTQYVKFCKSAFGKILNHYPVSTFDTAKKLIHIDKFPTQLLITFEHCQKANTFISPSTLVTAPPLLFIIDYQLNILNGFYYTPEIIEKIVQQLKTHNNKGHDSELESGSEASCSSCGGGD